MSVMGVTTQSGYDVDFVEWTARMAELIRAGHLDDVDLEHVAAEIEDMGKSERAAVESQLRRMLLHLVKQIQPQKAGASWRRSIIDSRSKILIRLKHSPSLRRYLEENLQEIYRDAIKDALLETGAKPADLPETCPYSFEQILEADWL
jgi:hypothetical protein